MAKEIRIKTIERPDGKARIYIIARDDALFRYTGEAEFNEDGETYWAPSTGSGLYETPEDAERAAYDEVDWLKHMK